MENARKGKKNGHEIPTLETEMNNYAMAFEYRTHRHANKSSRCEKAVSSHKPRYVKKVESQMENNFFDQKNLNSIGEILATLKLACGINRSTKETFCERCLSMSVGRLQITLTKQMCTKKSRVQSHFRGFRVLGVFRSLKVCEDYTADPEVVVIVCHNPRDEKKAVREEVGGGGAGSTDVG